MTTLKHVSIPGSGLGILLPYTIPGEPPESYARRCELEKLRNRDYNNPNEAEVEYNAIWNRWSAKYWVLKSGEKDVYLRKANLTGCAVSRIELLSVVDEVLTPEVILKQAEFELPKVIHPNIYRNFNQLLVHRNEIRDLQLVPVKDDALHESYNAIRDDPKLVTDVMDLFGDDDLVLAPNKYPYHLPQDVVQYILWVKRFESSRQHLVDFLARTMAFLELDRDDVIFFERPVRNKSKLVKGTFPAVRHVHVWFRKYT